MSVVDRNLELPRNHFVKSTTIRSFSILRIGEMISENEEIISQGNCFYTYFY